jgi:hypothetical protein
VDADGRKDAPAASARAANTGDSAASSRAWDTCESEFHSVCAEAAAAAAAADEAVVDEAGAR